MLATSVAKRSNAAQFHDGTQLLGHDPQVILDLVRQLLQGEQLPLHVLQLPLEADLGGHQLLDLLGVDRLAGRISRLPLGNARILPDGGLVLQEAAIFLFVTLTPGSLVSLALVELALFLPLRLRPGTRVGFCFLFLSEFRRRARRVGLNQKRRENLSRGKTLAR